mmetsp:Transcript_23164/g.65670  ORF Transcript_23164/g.65670 Transcript_23164/m.65670 type:complete len:312 (+) Transcript_23164:1063-1998(+)
MLQQFLLQPEILLLPLRLQALLQRLMPVPHGLIKLKVPCPDALVQVLVPHAEVLLQLLAPVVHALLELFAVREQKGLLLPPLPLEVRLQRLLCAPHVPFELEVPSRDALVQVLVPDVEALLQLLAPGMQVPLDLFVVRERRRQVLGQGSQIRTQSVQELLRGSHVLVVLVSGVVVCLLEAMYPSRQQRMVMLQIGLRGLRLAADVAQPLRPLLLRPLEAEQPRALRRALAVDVGLRRRQVLGQLLFGFPVRAVEVCKRLFKVVKPHGECSSAWLQACLCGLQLLPVPHRSFRLCFLKILKCFFEVTKPGSV